MKVLRQCDPSKTKRQPATVAAQLCSRRTLYGTAQDGVCSVEYMIVAPSKLTN